MPSRTSPLFLLTLLAVSANFTAPPDAVAATLKVGDMPPPKLGWHVKLSDYRGKIVIVTFWASWCSPCRKELPVLGSIQQQATRDKLVVFAVDWREDEQRFWQIKSAFAQHRVDLTLLSDDSGYIGHQYDVDAIPHMVIIGRDGRITAIHIGYGESEIPNLVKEINSLLAQSVTPAELPAKSATSGNTAP